MRRARRMPMSRPNTSRRARLRRACGRAMFTARAGRGALQGGVPSPLRPGGTRTQVRPAPPVPARDAHPGSPCPPAPRRDAHPGSPAPLRPGGTRYRAVRLALRRIATHRIAARRTPRASRRTPHRVRASSRLRVLASSHPPVRASAAAPQRWISGRYTRDSPVTTGERTSWMTSLEVLDA